MNGRVAPGNFTPRPSQTRSMPGLFFPRSRPWLWATAAEGGLEPAPVSRFRRASPHRIAVTRYLASRPFTLMAHDRRQTGSWHLDEKSLAIRQLNGERG